MPDPLPSAEVDRILVVVAHPDDADFGAAGTTATWTRAGIEVTYLLCTYEDQGGFDDTPREQVPAIREAEQRAAAAAVGVSDVRFLSGYHDGSLDPTRELQRDIVRVMRQVRPQRVLTQSPERWWDRIGASHPDHLAAGEATIRALYRAAQPIRLPRTTRPGRSAAVDGGRGMADGRRAGRARSRYHRHLRRQARRPAGPRQPDRAPRRRPRRQPVLMGHPDRPERRDRAGRLAEIFRVITTK